MERLQSEWNELHELEDTANSQLNGAHEAEEITARTKHHQQRAGRNQDDDSILNVNSRLEKTSTKKRKRDDNDQATKEKRKRTALKDRQQELTTLEPVHHTGHQNKVSLFEWPAPSTPLADRHATPTPTPTPDQPVPVKRSARIAQTKSQQTAELKRPTHAQGRVTRSMPHSKRANATTLKHQRSKAQPASATNNSKVRKKRKSRA
ncbi:MAG: hypothetical protein GOMPHAMPRED_005585 [Gomphillus americanus]|uniref:Uncharacterized protein n=1 Tax=Gomphillus americanus TaxID=1940652 RepID=A0A8H3IJB7_9LECA|nr:MAG: hypothetical protein GOMPHAMPRED_005585 [Gomphillus americanus]